MAKEVVKSKKLNLAPKLTPAQAKKELATKKSAEVSGFNPYAHLDVEIDNMEKAVGLTSMSVNEKEDRLDTGLLCLNLMMAGGLVAGGWYTFYGEEQSCKTTLATTVMGSIIRMVEFKGMAFFFDYEGSFSAEYANQMWTYNGLGKNSSASEVFGVQDKEGNYIVKPRIRYYAPAVGEDFFDSLAKVLKILPSVLLIDGDYYFIYANTKSNQKMLKGQYCAKYFKRFNKFKVPAPHGLPQAIFLVDSYPAMLSRRADDKDDGSDGLASQARMFADGIKRVKGRMKEKRVLVFGINQLREVPMAMYGPDKKEPCGTALRFFADARFRMTPISIPHGKGMMEEEDSLTGEGIDTYRYIRCHAFKNKLGGPQKANMTLRLYVANANGEGLGFDRVWDCYTYLKETGQVSGQRNKIKFGEGTPFAGKVLSWFEFKAMVDGDAELIKKGCQSMKLPKPVRIYEWCRKQIASGKGYDLYLDEIKNSHTKKAAKAKSKGDDDSADEE
jgi:RecA/RadA recombinase